MLMQIIDGEQPAASIISGAIEETVLADSLAESLWDKTLKAVVIKGP